jgi:hypothetical protein
MDVDLEYARNPANYWSCTKCLEHIFPFFLIDPAEFQQTAINPHIPIPPSVEDLLFDPFELNDETGVLDDIDPDKNFYNLQANNISSICKFLHIDQLNKDIHNLPNKPNLTVLHLNIRSLSKNFNELQSLIKSLDDPPNFIGVTETWLKPHNASLFPLDGYTHVYLTRPAKAGGGVSLFIKDTINFSTRLDLNSMDSLAEMLWIEIDGKDICLNKNLIMGAIYRPPGSGISDFTALLTDRLKGITLENKSLIYMGDFNIDLLKYDIHPQTSEFLEANLSLSILPMINKPTRVTPSTATLIDNFFTNIHNPRSITSSIIPIDVSDHFPILLTIDNSVKPANPIPPTPLKRDLSKKNIIKFNQIISNYDWTNVTNLTDTQQSYSKFHQIYSDTFNSCFPFKKPKTPYHERLPWLTDGIKKAIKTKHALYNKQLLRPNPTNVKKYKSYRNKLNTIIRNAERQYFESQLITNKSNLRKTWQIINMAINRKKTTKQKIESLNINGHKTQNPTSIAEHFTTYFTNIGNCLDKKIPISTTDPTSFIPNFNPNCIFLRPCIRDEVLSIIGKLKHCALGWDNIPTSLIQDNKACVADCLTHIINLSLTQGVFPTELKVAILVPIFKAGSTCEAGNYRPISLLTIFSKIFERVFYTRLADFFKKQKLLYELQFGFRENRSTQMAILTFMDKIINALEKGSYTIGIFLDFSKAFDTVNHAILLSKLYKYGVRGVANDWIKSYLTNREQFSIINGFSSTRQTIHCGVPQGSILGPLLFLIYINDLPNFSSSITSILFADDSNLFSSGPDLSTLQNQINEELPKLSNWLKSNRLSLNISKTHSMLFSPKKNPTACPNIKIDGVTLDTVAKTKFLGVILDNKLAWKDHALYTAQKMSKSIGILSLARKYLNRKTLLQLYYSFIYPYITYCNLAWGNAPDSTLWPILRTQKLAIRLIAGIPRGNSSLEYCKTNTILRLPELYKFSVAIFMFQFTNRLLPSIFDNFFIQNQHVHNYPTRNASKLRPPLTKTRNACKFIKNTGVGVWNDLNATITSIPKIPTFKKHLKRDLVKLY